LRTRGELVVPLIKTRGRKQFGDGHQALIELLTELLSIKLCAACVKTRRGSINITSYLDTVILSILATDEIIVTIKHRNFFLVCRLTSRNDFT